MTSDPFCHDCPLVRKPMYGVFFLKSAMIGALIVIALSVKTCHLQENDRYQETIAGREIYWAIRKSAQRQKVEQVLLGDSVAQQLYDNRHFNTEPFSLACNQAISCVGHYLLLKRFLQTNADQLPKQVVLLIHPSPLRNNLDQVFTFHYFLKPFNTPSYRRDFSPLVEEQIRKVPYHSVAQCPLVKMSNWSPEYTPDPQHPQNPIAPVTLEYLSKIKALCDSYRVQFCMIPVPVRGEWRTRVERDRAAYLLDASSIGMRREVEWYLDRLITLDDSVFLPDGVHFLDGNEIRTRYLESQLKDLAVAP